MGRWCLAQEQTANARFKAFSSEVVPVRVKKTRQNKSLDMRF
jgi:hypothetical protein